MTMDTASSLSRRLHHQAISRVALAKTRANTKPRVFSPSEGLDASRSRDLVAMIEQIFGLERYLKEIDSEG